VEDIKIQNVSGNGIALLEVDAFAIRRNIIRDAASGDGILADGYFFLASVTTRGTVEDNIIEGCAGGVSVLNGDSVGFRHNRIQGTTSGDGFFTDSCRGCLVVDNTINAAAANGMNLGFFRNGTLRGNVVADAQGGEGIWLHSSADNNLILANSINSNDKNGLLVDSSRNLIESNVLCNNGATITGFGMVLNGYSNIYRGNIAHGNLGPAASCSGVPATNDFCDATSGNTSPFNQPAAGLAGDNLMPGLL
jgi:parallel beta-helix repeat protein